MRPFAGRFSCEEGRFDYPRRPTLSQNRQLIKKYATQCTHADFKVVILHPALGTLFKAGCIHRLSLCLHPSCSCKHQRPGRRMPVRDELQSANESTTHYPKVPWTSAQVVVGANLHSSTRQHHRSSSQESCSATDPFVLWAASSTSPS